jgi:hypothetical protein
VIGDAVKRLLGIRERQEMIQLGKVGNPSDEVRLALYNAQGQVISTGTVPVSSLPQATPQESKYSEITINISPAVPSSSLAAILLTRTVQVPETLASLFPEILAGHPGL